MKKILLLISILLSISIRLLAETVSPVWDIQLIPNTNDVAVVSYKNINVFNIDTGKLIYSLKGHERAVRSLAVSKDGRTLISASNDKTVKIWNLEKRTLLKNINVPKGKVRKVIFGLDEKTIIGGRNLWNITTGKLIKEFREHSPINILAVSKSNEEFISLYGNSYFSEIYGKNKFEIHSNVSSLIVDKENKLLLLGYSNGFISVRDIENRYKEIDLWDTKGDGEVTSILLYKNQIITTSGNHMKFWDFSTREELKRESFYLKGEGFITSKMDEDIILTAYNWNGLGTYSLKEKRFVQSYFHHTDASTAIDVLSVAIDVSKNIVISGGADGNIVIWNMKTGKKLRTIKVNKNNETKLLKK